MPIEKMDMRRWAVIVLSLVIFGSCKKSNDVATNINKQAAIDDQAIANYIAINKLNAVHVGAPKVDTIGVWYIVEDAGTVPALYSGSSTITVGFTAKILGATQLFATSANAAGVNPSFVLGQTIKGWQLGISAAKINKGGRLRIIMSSRYGYGPYDQSQYGLPANSLLDFDINMYDVTN
ncbi:FKBP-type peptidyl-prolyl cis-trans isomerase [Mucilaginibacter ginkgonis]|uniref:Peptidyl-prolyl cis-trans isomerase n=1 Tax=Mucilaginibacter ginkgonis TaxID=2682091 RepID=A0A6I4HUX6_9SPHI|nr:FKBP-type peptidyl-prolyl cis-trans isomerase [Mucilaginibacter ginkgonis]QQL50094.1 FKBP-type peptidyl-prolyl cis-trans isomerase [Mucilaginibacter ginkgonis]